MLGAGAVLLAASFRWPRPGADAQGRVRRGGRSCPRQEPDHRPGDDGDKRASFPGRAVARADAAFGERRDQRDADGSRGFEGTTTQPQSQVSVGGSINYLTGKWYAANQAKDQVEVATLSVGEVRQQIAIGQPGAFAVIAARLQVQVEETSLRRRDLDYAEAS